MYICMTVCVLVCVCLTVIVCLPICVSVKCKYVSMQSKAKEHTSHDIFSVDLHRQPTCLPQNSRFQSIVEDLMFVYRRVFQVRRNVRSLPQSSIGSQGQKYVNAMEIVVPLDTAKFSLSLSQTLIPNYTGETFMECRQKVSLYQLYFNSVCVTHGALFNSIYHSFFCLPVG